MFISKKHLPRRTFLRGMGATIGLPLLNAMVPAGVALANSDAAPKPRMGFVYFPHGALMDRWSPATTGRDYEMTQILKPLEKYRDQLTIVSGLRNKAGESATPHAIMAGTWLGCVPPAVSHDPQAGTTIDQVASKVISQDTPFPSLELCGEGGGGPCDPGYGCSYGNTISFRTPNQPLPMENNPRKIFYQLFGQGNSDEERRAIVDETGSILDLVMEHTARLQRQIGAEDKVMLGEYMESIREVERRVQKMKSRDNSDLALPDVPVGVPDDFGDQLSIMFDLIALAWQANLTRISTFMIAKEVSMRTYTNLGISEAFHPLSHHQNNPAKMDNLAKIQVYHTQMFARFIDRLASVQDGDGTLLDHSIVLYGSNMSNSDKHNNDPLPSAVLGRGFGRIKGGQHLQFPQDTPLANLMHTLLDRAGVPVETFGDSTGIMAEV
ncbi:MAG: DUF1552 domain-containing protein [Gammaproteobacteria bacterium]|nr:DUF1552 domain-containing protein [Gammaproteobacteria bacterium]